jgi:hypothetical protein
MVLRDLARQLDDGRVYDRDLPELAVRMRAVLEVFGRRQTAAGVSSSPDRRLLQ